MPSKDLPKILYIGDVPVELSSAGATLLYRLLQYYPKDKLVVIQRLGLKDYQHRIPGIKYHIWKSRLERLRYTRFAKYTKGLFLADSILVSAKAKKIIHDYQPDIILTVSIQLMWLNALRLSEKMNIPLYLILHDDWLTTEDHGKWQNYLSGMFENFTVMLKTDFVSRQQWKNIIYHYMGSMEKLFIRREERMISFFRFQL